MNIDKSDLKLALVTIKQNDIPQNPLAYTQTFAKLWRETD